MIFGNLRMQKVINKKNNKMWKKRITFSKEKKKLDPYHLSSNFDILL